MSLGNPPMGALFPNGNAMFFDEHGEQISDYQKYGHRGVHKFREEYPSAEVYWASWTKGTVMELSDRAIDEIKQPE